MDAQCKTCHGPLIQKNRIILFSVGAILLALAAAGLIVSLYWIAIPFFLVGSYLMTWSTIGKGLWCRQCKKF